MPWDLSPFADVGLNATTVESLLSEHETNVRPGLDRLWSYYRNPSRPAAHASLGGARPTSIGGVPGLALADRGPCAPGLAQASGLPRRFGGREADGTPREIVIENDIAWRIDTLVDFLFGRPVRFASGAADPGLARTIEAALAETWERSGGIALLQDAALLGCVHGSVDFVVRESDDSALVEVIEAPRAIPMLDPGDYRSIRAYMISAPISTPASHAPGEDASVRERLLQRLLRRTRRDEAHEGRVIEVLSNSHRQVYVEGRLVVDEPNRTGVLPVAHAQNSSQPYRYAGLSDVEPLVPLQDELNTRLSDRAHRVTMQSFNMYLAKGIDFGPGAQGVRVAPGQVWLTDNPEASIQPFGGDGHSPSEDRHIEELREALDKSSGVSPVVIGVIRERLGHLSSENALRITLTGILNKTARKRVTYGRALRNACAIVLASLDARRILRTNPADRAVRLEWTDPLPIDERSRLEAALRKRDLGVPANVLMRELGYDVDTAAAGAAGGD